MEKILYLYISHDIKKVYLDLKFRMNIHVVIHPFPGPPTQEKAYRALLAAEWKAASSGSGTVGAVHVINNGLRLERDQCAF